ncbi:MAG: DUF2306 domain-containing protein [Pseudolysinimonas sp.]
MAETSTLVPVARKRRTYQWMIPTGLVLLSLVPVIAGAMRVSSLALGVETTPDNARFTGMPLPVIIHIISATIYCLLGAFQFQPSFRRRVPRWHRVSGRILVPMGITAAASGLWMTTFYALPAHDYGALPAARWIFGLGMIASILLALRAVLRRDFSTHRAWMMRGYAIGIGAGTQLFTFLAWLLIAGAAADATKPVPMIAGWVINLVIAEWIIRRRPTS